MESDSTKAYIQNLKARIAALEQLLDVNKSTALEQTEKLHQEISERKETEKQALIFKRFSEASGQSFGMAALDGSIIYMNPTLCRLLGERDPEDVLGKKVFQYYPEKLRERMQKEIIPSVMETGQWIGELCLLNGRGGCTPTIENVFLIRDEDETPLCIANFITDISERKQTEDALRESEQKFRLLFEKSVHGILVADLEAMQFCYANPSICRMLGYSQTELLTLGIKDIHPKDSLAQVMPDLELQRRGVKSMATLPCLRKDGTVFYADINTAEIVIDGRECVMGFFADITERRQAEAALQESRQQFQDIVETMYDWVWEVDAEGRYTYVSPRVKDMLGYECEELLGKTPFDLMPAAEARRLSTIFQSLISEQRPIVSLENINIHKDGHHIVMETNGSPFWDADGNLKGYRGADRDITERRQAEEALKESEERYHLLFEEAQDGIALGDVNTGELVACNKALCRLTERDKTELMGQPQGILHPPHQLQNGHSPSYRLHKTGDPGQTLEDNLLSKSGKMIPVEIRSARIRMNGRDYILGIFRDITERKRSDEALRFSNERFQSIMDSVDALIYVSDFDTHEILFFNKKTIDAFGEGIGKKCWQVIQTGQKGPCPFCTNNRLLTPEGQAAGVYVWEFQNTVNQHWYECRDAAIRWPDGRLVRMEIATDITERRQAADEVKRLNEKLEQIVAERTRQLLDAQEELVRKEKLSILGRLAGSVGHELRNPLGVMNNAIYFLEMVLSDADETVNEYLGIIKHEIDHSQRIITDLLDFARTRTPQKKSATVGGLISESLSRCTVPQNVSLRTEIPEPLPAVSVDPLQMGQVFENLIMNGVQAMPEGGALTIRAAQERNALKICVIDTGEGISAENMKNLFQPLFTTKAKGIGLGLTVCKNLTEANWGRIEVESRAGEGTTFTIILPVEGNKTSK